MREPENSSVRVKVPSEPNMDMQATIIHYSIHVFNILMQETLNELPHNFQNRVFFSGPLKLGQVWLIMHYINHFILIKTASQS